MSRFAALLGLCSRICMLAALIVAARCAPAGEPGPELRVMSYNIRYGTAADGENHWDRRKDFLVETIRNFMPDLLGTQETLAFQRDFLAANLQEYEQLGAGRDDGKEAGEMCALYYRKDRFQKLAGGHFWLSETPDRPGSKSWDSALPRMVTWVRLHDLRFAKSRPILFLNTHFDHRGETARLESARLLARKAAELAGDADVVLTGDFNAPEGSPPYKALFEGSGDAPPLLFDTYRLSHPQAADDEGTFSGFRAEATRGPRIDWIAASSAWQARSSAIDRTARGGRTPSDHFAVVAVLVRQTPAGGQTGREHAEAAVERTRYDVERHNDIAYFDGEDADPRKHKLDLFVPRQLRQFPVLFFVHGGGWATGDRKLYSAVGMQFARKGIGTVVISYRLSPGVRHPAHIEDVARAFAWTHQNIARYGGRADCIFVSGQSAGGHLAALLATNARYLEPHGLTPGDIRGVIPISGVYVFRGRRMQWMLGDDPLAAEAASPLGNVSGREPPFLILFADADFAGCAAMSKALCQALQLKQVEAEWKEIPRRNHISIMLQMMLDERDATSRELLEFMARHGR